MVQRCKYCFSTDTKEIEILGDTQIEVVDKATDLEYVECLFRCNKCYHVFKAKKGVFVSK